MSDDPHERLRSELDGWRARFDHLRVQVGLGKLEARDKLRELERQLRPALDDARGKLDALARGGATEVRVLAKSLRAGYEELLRTHAELSREAGRARGEGRGEPPRGEG